MVNDWCMPPSLPVGGLRTLLERSSWKIRFCAHDRVAAIMRCTCQLTNAWNTTNRGKPCPSRAAIGRRRLLNLSIGTVHFCVSACRSAALFGKFRIYPALIGVFFAIDRRNERRIFIEIGSPYPIFLAVRVDPRPQHAACNRSLGTRLTLDAHDIGCKPMAIAPAQASAMVGA